VIYTVWIVTPEGYAHSQVFTEQAAVMRDALIALGHEAKVTTMYSEISGRVIVFGAHLFHMIDSVVLPDDTILFNSEHFDTGSIFSGDEYLQVLRNFEVWDCSSETVEFLAEKGIRVKHCDLGYMPCLSSIKPEFEDIDVVFCGSMNERRQKIMDDLKAAGVGVVPIFGYGDWRDRYLARARIVLNLHYYDRRIFEIFRCSYLMANKKCIVSEAVADQQPYYDGISFAEYDGLVDKVKELLANPDERKRLARTGFELFSAKSQAEIIKELL
jgi:hypothetical protein